MPSISGCSLIPKVRGFKIASLNIVSLPSQLDEIGLLLEDEMLDILALNETHLNGK